MPAAGCGGGLVAAAAASRRRGKQQLAGAVVGAEDVVRVKQLTAPPRILLMSAWFKNGSKVFVRSP